MREPINPWILKFRNVLTHEWFYAPVVLLFISALVLGNQLSGASFATFQDNTYMYLPLLAHASRLFASGEYPYWINSLVGGLPLFDSPQVTFDYPLYFLRSNIYRDAFAALIAVHFITLLHYVILLFTSYIMMRTLALSPLSALTGATFFALSPNLLSYAFAVTLMAPYSWCPLFISAIIMTLRGDRFTRPFFLGVFSISMLVLSAPSLPFIHCLYVCAVLTLWWGIPRLIRGEFVGLLSTGSKLLVMGTVSALIVSPYLISELMSMPGFIRWIGSESGPLVGTAKIPFSAFLLGQLTTKNIFDVIIPIRHAHIIGNVFIGAGGVFFILLSVHERKKTFLYGALVFLTAWGFLSAFGSTFGLAQLNYRIPFVNLMREPGRHLFIFIFGASALIAVGVEHLLRNVDKEPAFFLTKTNIALAGSVLSILIGGYLYLNISPTPLYACVLIMTALGALWYFISTSKRLRLLLLTGVAGSILLAPVNSFPMKAVPLGAGDYFSASNLRSHEVLREISRIPDISQYRVMYKLKEASQFWAMNGTYYGIRSSSGYMNPLPYQQFAQVYDHGDLRGNYRELLGTRYILCDECDNSTFPNYSVEKDFGEVKLLKSDRAFPRYKVLFSLAGDYRDANEFYERLANNPDFKERLLVEVADYHSLKGLLEGGPVEQGRDCVVFEESATHNTLKLSISCERAGVLVLNEFFSPNWVIRATDGVKARHKVVTPTRVNLNQIALPLGKGGTYLEVEYKPQVFYWLRFISKILIGCLSLVLTGIILRLIVKKLGCYDPKR
jgi:hypothetical protein